MSSLILVDMNKDIIEAWKKAFESCPEVMTFEGPFEQISEVFQEEFNWKTLVAAGNSYGVMGGGIDYCISRYFPGVEGRVRHKIKDEWQGELNVGSAITVDLLGIKVGSGYKSLIYAPTMMAPVDIRYTHNVYLAMKAALQQWHKDRANNILIVPGLGGGCGNVPPDEVARQMFIAYYRYKTQYHVFDTQAMRESLGEIKDINKWSRARG